MFRSSSLLFTSAVFVCKGIYIVFATIAVDSNTYFFSIPSELAVSVVVLKPKNMVHLVSQCFQSTFGETRSVAIKKILWHKNIVAIRTYGFRNQVNHDTTAWCKADVC